VAVVPTPESSDAGQSRLNADENEDMSFIYGLAKPRNRTEEAESDCQNCSNSTVVSSPLHASPANSISVEAIAPSIYQNPSHLSQLPPSHRLLLDHFCHAVTRSFSLHLATHHGFCMTYLPLALDPANGNGLLPAVLEAAALHRKSLGLYDNEREIIAFRHASIRQFKLPAIGKNPAEDDKALAMALILCLCDILAGGEKANSWQLHLQGAIAIIQQASGGDTSQESDLRKFLRRWCESLEVLSILGPNSKLAGQTVESSSLEYIDEFHGFCRSLIPIFQEVHLLLMECQSLQEMFELVGPSHPMVERMSYVVEQRCQTAINSVKSSLAQTSHTFHPCIQSYVSPQVQSEFISINQAFHHGVLLHIYRRVQGLPPTDPNIEASVEAIIQHLSELDLRDEACPGVAMLQPLFDAGCESYSLHNRDRVIELMNTLEKRYGMGNVSYARTFLQEYWMEFDQQRSHGVDLHWDTYISEFIYLVPLDHLLIMLRAERMGAIVILAGLNITYILVTHSTPSCLLTCSIIL
jgi:Fungal specific transcription factor domain